ncbi:MAG: helix-turn-helix transcriptional regulator [Limisphaerales bacterium]
MSQVANWPELAKEVNWRVSRLAEICGVSSRTLERFFVNETGRCPKAWLLKWRIQRADGLLRGGASVKETAGLLSYKHPNHLSNEFKNRFGSCPTKRYGSEQSWKIRNVAFL